MRAGKGIQAALLLIVLLALPAHARPRADKTEAPGLVNFAYLESLRVEVPFPGKGTLTTWRVTPASIALRAASHEVGLPPEKLSARRDLVCTEDIAWVALAYLKAHEIQKRPGAREEARKAIRTLVALQRSDGTFPAYVAPGAPVPVIQEQDWSATARGVQAIGAGLRVLGPDKESKAALNLLLTRLRALWAQPDRAVGATVSIDGKNLPAWLPGNRSDVAAGMALGLLDWLGQENSVNVREVVRGLCEGIMATQHGSRAQFPWLAFLPRADQPALWYPDGAFQATALARAGVALNKPGWVSAAQAEVDSVCSLLLANGGPLHQFSPRPHAFPQLPGGAAALASNALAVETATHRERHAVMAGLLAAWFTGGNGTAAPYNPATGRCADQLTADGVSGEASPGATARALWTLLQIGASPGAQWLSARPTSHGVEPLVLQAVEGRPVEESFLVQEMDLPGGRRRVARMGPNQPFWLRFEVRVPACYRVDMVYLKDGVAGRAVDVRLDGEAILEVPLEAGDAVLKRLRAVPDTDLETGLHTLGVRSGGLWQTGEVVLDAFVIQPVVEWRLWESQPGRHMLFFRSLSDTDQAITLPAALGLGQPRHVSAWDANNQSVTISERRLPSGDFTLTAPAQGFGALEW
ncbi:MAG: hypothetical protein FJX76_17680 [Armatimonadetes bacterium]|nr:hypothetical protein [Armatimonadota bacterium]